jgi:hypothetical protein
METIVPSWNPAELQETPDMKINTQWYAGK